MSASIYLFEIFRFVDLFKTFRFAARSDARGLTTILKSSKSKYSRWEAAEALGKIGDKGAVAVLIEALKDKKPLVRWKAAEALGEVGDRRGITCSGKQRGYSSAGYLQYRG